MERFREGEFDLAYSRNALDHSYDPMRAIKQMVMLVKPGQYVYLDHKAHEAVKARYTGLHQWNFDVKDGRFVLWSKTEEIDIANALSDRAEVTVSVVRGDLVATLRRMR